MATQVWAKLHTQTMSYIRGILAVYEQSSFVVHAQYLPKANLTTRLSLTVRLVAQASDS